MRVPRRIAEFNKRVTNPAARAITPWLPYLGTLEHVGRKSGKRYRTPLLVFETDHGYAILVGYGLQTDWLQNVLAGGATVLHKRRRAVPLADPRVISKAEAAAQVVPRSRRLFQAFPYNEAALLLTRADSAG